MHSRKEWDERRVTRLIHNAIKKFGLNLDGLSVFTEAATGTYAFTSIIAALAKAKEVYAYTRDSKYGKKEDIRKQIVALAGEFEVSDRIVVVYDKSAEIIGKCDIVTNSGFVRPIDKKIIDAMKQTAVVPLMFEAWENRQTDIDLAYCHQKGIPVLGTNEGKDGANLFDCLGFLVSKVLLECGMEVFGNNILILGGNEIATAFQQFFNRNFIKATLITFNEAENEPERGVIHYKLFQQLAPTDEYDAVICAELLGDALLVGEDGVINAGNLHRFSDSLFVHVCGKVEMDFVKQKGIRMYPESIASLQHMSVAGDYLGPSIPIQLTTAGLKVGEIMARLRIEGKACEEVIELAAKNPLISTLSPERSVEERARHLTNPELLRDLRQLHYELRDFTKKKYNRINPFSEDLFGWEEKGNFWTHKNAVIYDSATVCGDVEIGDHVWIGPFCEIDGTGGLRIGDYCTISAGAQLITHDTVKYHLSGGKCKYEYAPVTIGNYCFIGAGSILLKGSSIGDHCLVAANSLVNSSFEDFSIIAGMPAKRIGTVRLLDDGVKLEYFRNQ